MGSSIGLPQALPQIRKKDLSQANLKQLRRHTYPLLSHSCTLPSGASLPWEGVSPRPQSTRLIPSHSLYTAFPRQELLRHLHAHTHIGIFLNAMCMVFCSPASWQTGAQPAQTCAITHLVPVLCPRSVPISRSFHSSDTSHVCSTRATT